LRAEALVIKGDCVALLDKEQGVALLETAVETGESCGDDHDVGRAATELVYHYAARDTKLAERTFALASAAFKRIGGDVRLESWLANNVGVLRSEQGRLDEARAEFERAVALKTRTLGPDHPDVAVSLANLSVELRVLHRYDEARAVSDRAEQIYRRWIPGDSPAWYMFLANKSHLLCDLGRLDEAETAAHPVLAVIAHRNPPHLGDLLTDLACVEVARSTTADAVGYLERTLAAQADDSPLRKAETQFRLAVALQKSGRNPRRAASLARTALATYGALPAFTRERAEVATWVDRQHRNLWND